MQTHVYVPLVFCTAYWGSGVPESHKEFQSKASNFYSLWDCDNFHRNMHTVNLFPLNGLAISEFGPPPWKPKQVTICIRYDIYCAVVGTMYIGDFLPSFFNLQYYVMIYVHLN